jgi:GNAT superfamily N-acetyltransferase
VGSHRSHRNSPNKLITTKDPEFTLRFATPDDSSLLLSFMRKLGSYQKMADKIVATEEGLRTLLVAARGEAVFGDYAGETVAFAYFCQTSSAFIGQSGMYIDGFFVDESMRGKGLGKIMMAWLSKLAVERGCKRLEWACLDWNHPTIAFYKGLGAYSVDGMTIYRFAPDTLQANAALF